MGFQEPAPRLLLTVSPWSHISSLPWLRTFESAHWNSGKVLEAEWRLFPGVKEVGNAKRFCVIPGQRSCLVSSRPSKLAQGLSCILALEAEESNLSLNNMINCCAHGLLGGFMILRVNPHAPKVNWSPRLDRVPEAAFPSKITQVSMLFCTPKAKLDS